MASYKYNNSVPMKSQFDNGLDLLMSLDKCFIDHKNTRWEVFTSKNCYPIVDVNGQPLFFVQKLPGKPGLMRFGDSNSWTSWIYDINGNEIFKLEKFNNCHNDAVEVFSGTSKLGTILKQKLWYPTISILNFQDTKVLSLKGRLFGLGLDQHKFKILTMDGNQIGEIKRIYSGERRSQDYFSNYNYVTTFSLLLDVKYKAILMASMILMDFAYSKKTRTRNSTI